MRFLTLLAIAATALALTGCDPAPKADEPTAETNAATSTKTPGAKPMASDAKTETTTR